MTPSIVVNVCHRQPTQSAIADTLHPVYDNSLRYTKRSFVGAQMRVAATESASVRIFGL